ncbi:hypothetical protein HYE67_004129 [Fusarium culmorum]|uniref:Uncharacterized protein n=1 Tax=Fusarium culmorum TaxID=5516 RepID=A0A2T4GK28_FUSCU|nr:hypothetical protein FCULG_00001322 [Fusarium culmorum]QPC61898.1 hypothetical protein HYE67_004129 [Fusarium culmorum]
MAEESKTCPSFDSRMICKSRAKDSCCATAGSSFFHNAMNNTQLDEEGQPGKVIMRAIHWPVRRSTLLAHTQDWLILHVHSRDKIIQSPGAQGSRLKAQVAASKWWPHVSYNHAP